MSAAMDRNRTVECVQCSIIDAGVDCVVNASNSSAALGGGVSRALFDECGGAEFQREIREQLEADLDGALEEGDCLVTSGGSSKRFRHVLHVQAVDYRGNRAVIAGDGVHTTVSSPAKVMAATEAALRAAAGLVSGELPSVAIAFPLLGAGSGGLSPTASLKAMVDGMRAFFREEPGAAIARVAIAVPEDDRYHLCKKLLRQLLPP